MASDDQQDAAFAGYINTDTWLKLAQQFSATYSHLAITGAIRIEALNAHTSRINRWFIFFGIFLIAYAYGLDGTLRYDSLTTSLMVDQNSSIFDLACAQAKDFGKVKEFEGQIYCWAFEGQIFLTVSIKPNPDHAIWEFSLFPHNVSLPRQSRSG
jgi:hypothetical protein